jgi:hypothetical protein
LYLGAVYKPKLESVLKPQRKQQEWPSGKDTNPFKQQASHKPRLPHTYDQVRNSKCK